MITRFFITAGLMFFDIIHLVKSAGQTEAFVWAGLLIITTTLLALTAVEIQNER